MFPNTCQKGRYKQENRSKTILIGKVVLPTRGIVLPNPNMYFVYILRTSSNTLYIGQTNNLKKRLDEHKKKLSKSAKYIRYFSSFDLVYKESYATRVEAMRRESQLKKWPKAKKEALISKNSDN